MGKIEPRICCLDLDTFFVSVERLLDPTLEGKPVVVGGKPGQRGVVTAASYEVREYGVRSGMSLTKAARLCPHAIFISTSHGTYGDYAKRVKAEIERICPLVQVASIDEFYMDLGGCERMYFRDGDADDDAAILRTVRELTQSVKAETGLPCSVGIATSKQLAKIASGFAKPAGVLMVRAGREEEFLAPLPVGKFPGIGPVGGQRLARLGITTLGQLSAMSEEAVVQIFGKWGPSLLRGAKGEGNHRLGRDRPAFKEHDPQGSAVGSISNERTFREDVNDPSSIEAMLCSLTERVCWRARKRGVRARTVSLKLRYADFETITRAKTIAPSNSELEIYPVIKELYSKNRERTLPIRLLGIAFSNLGLFDEQLELFSHGNPRLHEAVDSIREKFGFAAVNLASSKR